MLTLALRKTGLAGLKTDLVLADIGLLAAVYDRLDIPPFRFDDAAVPLWQQ